MRSHRLPSNVKVGVGIQNDAQRSDVTLFEANTDAINQSILAAIRLDAFDLAELPPTADVFDDMRVIRAFDHQNTRSGHGYLTST